MVKQLRSCDGAAAFWQAQVSTDLMSVVCETVRCLSRVADLERCMFVVMEAQALKADDMELVIEDDMADTYAQLVMSVVGFRMRRCLHWFGWPTKLFRLLAGREVAGATLREFREAVGVWRAFDSLPDKSRASLHRRSPFHKVSVQQMVIGLEESNYEATAEVKEVLTSRARLHLSTIPCEEMIGAQKNSKSVQVGRRFRRPEYSMGVALSAGVLDKRSSFQAAGLDVAMEANTEKLSSECFSTKAGNRSLPFQQIVSTKGAAEFYSPAAQHLNTQHCDMVMLQVMSGHGVSPHGWVGPACAEGWLSLYATM